jgi:hypothetical protein
MDTKPLEIEAESIVQHKLIKHDFHVSKPTFDKNGADLLIIDDINNKFTKTVRVQCKGRTVGSSATNIKIPVAYVDENFIVFLYTVNEEKEDLLFIFFSEEIREWNINNNHYSLSISSAKLSTDQFSSYLFSPDKVNSIKSYLNKAPIKKYTTVLIDEIFLNKAINKTIAVYQEIYPKRKLIAPSHEEAVARIIEMYNNFGPTGLAINCHLYSYEENILSETKVSRIEVDSNTTAKLHREITDQFVSFEMLEHLERLINTENIILVSNEVLFDVELKKLSDKGVEVTMVLYSSHEGRNIYAKQKWGDIMYPLALAMGLQRHEW